MAAKNSIRILLVEDDPNLSLVLKDFLELQDYKVDLYSDGKSGMNAFLANSYDLCLLDVMLPAKDGFSLAEDIRTINSFVPIIFLTAKSLGDDRVKGFQVGCDDYITKPFSTEELSLRIEAILKRCQRQIIYADNVEVYQLGAYEFDYSNVNLKFGDEIQTLTRKEAELLRLLARHRNKLLLRETALKAIWGDDDYFVGRSMDVFITKLRKHLKNDPSINITNVHGSGFKLETPE